MLSSEPIRAPEARPFHRRDAAADAVRRALDLLGRASDDWRNGGQSPVGPVHWPAAVRAAQSTLRSALEVLGERRQEGALPPENCRGDHLDEALDCYSDEDCRAGLAWYNSATVAERRHWHQVACSDVPADAWEAYKAGGPPP